MAYASRAPTDAETRYAQIEKELLATVFAYERFDPYVYGCDIFHVETDHKPLEQIFVKELNAEPKRLQRMLLRLQRYSRVMYKKGRDMYLADTLSRAFLLEVNPVDHRAFLPVSKERRQQIKYASADYPALQQLRTSMCRGWPKQRSDVPECLYLYIRDVLAFQYELVSKGQRLVVRASRPTEEAYGSATQFLHRHRRVCSQSSLYWPRMATELRQYISKCDICLVHRDNQAKEPLLQHEVVPRPWAKVAADLCEVDFRVLLVISDYYSNFIEVARLKNVKPRNVIEEMTAVFTPYVIPDVLVTDNGPQFASAEFSVFANTWL